MLEGNFIGWRRAAIKPPLNEVVETRDLFFAFQPNCHLSELVFVIGHGICILGEVDMKTFGMFGVVIISCPKKLDRWHVV